MLFDSPFRDPARLVFVAERVHEGDGAALSYPDLVEYQKENNAFESLAGFRLQSWNLTGTSEPERVDGLQTSANLFTTLGVQPLVGRVFSTEEDQPGGAHVVVIGEGLWRRLFGEDRGVLGRAITLDGNPYTVIGVMPTAFQVWRRVDLFTPIGQAAARNKRGDQSIYAVGRLRPTASLERARAAMDVVAARLSATYPDTHAGRASSLTPLRERSLGDLRRALWVLSAISVLVLVLGCINVASLLHAHGIERMRELSIRVALGAGRARLVRQMLTESLLLGLTGSLAGLLVAHWAVQLLSTMIPRFVADAVPVRLDATALIFNCLAGLIVGLASGAIPAWLVTRAEVSGHLTQRAEGAASLGHTRVQNGLVVAQVTLAVVTLVGASLMLRSFTRLLGVPLGIDAKGVVLADLTLPYPKYSNSGQLWRFYESVLGEARQQTGVHSAALVTTAPMSFVPWNLRYAVEGEQPPAPGHEPECDYAGVAGDYFATLGIHVVEGRAFTEHDDARGVLVALVDRSFSRKHFPGQSAVGKRVSFPMMGGRWLQIVGVVDDVRNWGPDGVSLPAIYCPLLQSGSPYVTLAVRAPGATQRRSGDDAGRHAASGSRPTARQRAHHGPGRWTNRCVASVGGQGRHWLLGHRAELGRAGSLRHAESQRRAPIARDRGAHGTGRPAQRRPVALRAAWTAALGSGSDPRPGDRTAPDTPALESAVRDRAPRPCCHRRCPLGTRQRGATRLFHPRAARGQGRSDGGTAM